MNKVEVRDENEKCAQTSCDAKMRCEKNNMQTF